MKQTHNTLQHRQRIKHSFRITILLSLSVFSIEEERSGRHVHIAEISNRGRNDIVIERERSGDRCEEEDVDDV